MKSDRKRGSWSSGSIRLVPLSLLLLVAAPAMAEPLVVGPEARRPGDVVALGRDVSVAGSVAGSVVSTGGPVVISGHVGRHVVVLGSGVTVRAGAHVDGDLLVLGGPVVFEDGSSAETSVGGRVRSIEALEAAFLAEIRTSPVRDARVSPLLVSFRLVLLLGWLVVGFVLLRLFPRRLLDDATRLPGRGVLLGAVGALAVLTGLLLSAFFFAVLPATAGLAATALVAVSLVVLKAWGLSAVFVAVGRRIAGRVARGGMLWGDPAALSAGLLALGLPSLVPVIGPVVWGIASLVGIGLSLLGAVGGERRVSAEAGWRAAA